MEYGNSRSPPTLPSKFKTYQTLIAHPDQEGKMAHGLRNSGSAALNTAMVASGALDMYWETGVRSSLARILRLMEGNNSAGLGMSA